MSDKVTYKAHLKYLDKIKNRQNQYPIYEYNDSKTKKDSKKKEINTLINEIKRNNKNIASVINNLNSKNKKYYDNYLNKIQHIQRQMLNGLITKNDELKIELKILKKEIKE